MRRNADVLGRGRCAKDDSNERDDALREGSSKRGQDRADRVLGNPELAADPFDTVDEKLAADVDQRRRAQQQQNRKDQLDDSSIALSASEIEGASLPDLSSTYPLRAQTQTRRPKVWLDPNKRADGTRALGPVC